MTSQDTVEAGDASVASSSSFTDFALPDDLQRTLAREGLVEPTPIQKMSIPILLEGRDLVGLAQTGTGKTAAFLLPMLSLLVNTQAVRAGQPPKALILAPTRELANQISTNVNRLARDLNIRHIAVFGGARYDGQIKALKRGVDIVVATPGRLMDLMDRGAFDPRGIEFLVLDEADHMLDLGFFEPIKEIVSNLPDSRQTMLFSATMPPQIEQLGKQFLSNPERVKAPQSGMTADKIAQRVTLMAESDKRDALCDVLNNEDTGQCLIFVRTKRRADALAKFMQTRGFAVDALHGDMRQGLRQKVLRNFREGQLQALIATDVAARGIDVAGLSHVVNFDITDTPEAYVHRIGRTGRAGLGGLAISFCSPSEEPRLGAIVSMVGPRCELFDTDGNPVTDFRAKAAPKKRGRPTRNRRDGAGGGANGNGGNRRDAGRGGNRNQESRGGHRGQESRGGNRSQESRGSDRPRNKPAARPSGDGDARSAKRQWNDGNWSPVDNDAPRGGAARRDDRPNKSSRPAKPSGKWNDKPRGEKSFGDKPRGKWNDKPRGEKSFGDKPRSDKPAGKWADKPRGDGKKSAFGKNPFAKDESSAKPRSKPHNAKPNSGKPFRKSASKPAGKPGGKPGGRSGGKPGGNERMKRRG